MPTYHLTAPNGRTYKMTGPAGLRQQDIVAHVLSFDPEAGVVPPPPKTGVMAALQSGAENWYSSGKAGVKGLFGDEQAAAEEALAAQQDQGRRLDPGVGLEQVGKAYDEGGIWGAGKEIVSQVPRALAQSAPDIAGAAAGAAGGARIGSMIGSAFGPVGTGVGALVGGVGGGILAGILPQTGRNLAAQQEETPGEVSYGKAVAAGGAQAALESVTPLALMGGRVASKIFGRDVTKLLTKLGPEAAEEVAKRGLLATVARSGGVGAAGEATTEVMQEAIGRLQAGKSLLDDDALSAYAEAAYGGVLPGFPLGAAGGAYDRSGAQQTVQDRRAAAEQLAAQKVAEEQAEEDAKAAQLDAERKADPGYAAHVAKRYAAFEAQHKAMLARRSLLQKEGTIAGKQEANELGPKIGEFVRANQPLIDEFKGVRDTLMAQAAEQQAAAAANAPPAPPADEPKAPAGMLFGGYEDAKKQERIDELKAQIAEHDEMLPRARDQMVEIMRGGKSNVIARGSAGLKKREKELADAWKELDALDPTIRQQRDADELRKTALTNFNPATAQKQIAALTEKIEGVQDPDEAGKAQKWATDREKLQALLDEHKKAQTVELAPDQGEDLFDLGTRLRREEKQSGQRQLGQERGLEALGRGEATQEWPNLDPAAHEPPGTAYGDTPEALAQETDAAFDRTFANRQRSGVLDTTATGTQAPGPSEGTQIVERLQSLPDEDRGDTAKELQALGTKIKQNLYGELQHARTANNETREDALVEAIRSIAAMEKLQDDIGPGRAHYRAEFYDIASKLVPGVLQRARAIVGVRGPRATNIVDTQREAARARLARTDDPEQTAAMEAALEGETIEKPRAATGQRHLVQKGAGPRRAEPRTTETGQGFLFEPAPAPAATADTPRQLVQQRISTLLAMPSLAPQAKRTLQHAADVLDGATVAPRILDAITETVRLAERGVGFIPEGADKPAARPKIVAQEGKARVTPPAPAAVQTQALETEPVATAEHIDADVQPDLIDTMYVGRATPQTFQRALDTGALPSKRAPDAARKHVMGLRTAAALLKQQANNVRAIIADVAKARARLQAVDKTLAAMDPKSRRQRAEQAHEDMKEATNAALRASDAAKKANDRADAAKAAKEDAQEKKHRGRAERAEQEARRQEESVENYKAEIRAINEADVAPALERVAKRHDALVEELARVEKEGAKNAADLKVRQGELYETVTKQQEKGKRVSKAPDVARKPSILRMEQPRVKAPEPTEEERRTSAAVKLAGQYAAETGARVDRVEAREKPAEDLSKTDTLVDAIDTALETPGVTRAALKAIADRVGRYATKRAFSETNKSMKRLDGINADIQRLQAENKGGVVPPQLRGRYQSAVLSLTQLENQIKAAKTAEARARLLDQVERVKARIKEFNEKRTPIADDPHFRELRRQAALLEFERDASDVRRTMLEAAAGYTPAQKQVVAAAIAPPLNWVGPATKLGTDKPATRMAVAKATKQQKTLYQGKASTPTAETKQAQEATKDARETHDAAIKQAKQEQKVEAQARADLEAEGGRAGPEPVVRMVKAAQKAKAAPGAKSTEGLMTAAERAELARQRDDMAAEGGIPTAKEAQDTIAEMFAQIAAAPLSEANMDLAHDGQLLSVIDSLASTSESPVARELAAKLRPLLLRTKLRVEADPNKPHRAGLYDSKTNTITLNPLALNEETLLHEAVHAATLRLLSAPTGLTREQTNARNELLSMLKRVQKDPAFSNEYGETNIAEFASEVMTNPDLRAKLDKQKPGFWKRLINAVLQMFGVSRPSASDRAMANVEKMFEPSRSFSDNEWEALQYVLRSTQSPTARARNAGSDIETPKDITFSQMLSADATKTGLRGVVEGGNKALAAEMALVDQRAPILKALSKGTQQAYQQAMYFLRKSDARMAQVYSVLQNGPAQLKRDKKGNHIVESGNGPSAKALFEEIGKLPGESVQQKFADAQAYMVAQRAANKGWDKLGWETSAEKQAAAKRMMAEIDADPAKKAKLEAVRSMYNDYNKGMVQFLADTGAISKELAATLTKDGDYVPFYRVNGTSGAAELVMGEGTHIRVGDVRKQPHLQALKGDEGKLLPLNEAILRNTMLLTDMGLSNLATKNIAYALQNMSPKDVNRIHSLKKGQQAPAGADIVKFKQDGEDRWMRITSDGTPFEGIPAEMLVQSLEGTHTMLTGMGKVGQWFGDVLRSGITRNPAYVLRQLIRDPMSAAFTAGTSRGPLGAMMESMREFASQTQGNSKTAETLLRKGVAQSGIFSGDADDLNKFSLQLASGEQGAITRLISMADRAAMRADAATRAQVYDDALKATGSEMQAEMAAMEMMNFSKRGSSPTVQNAARLIPFLNAQLQGLNVLYKAARGQMSAEQAMEIKAKFIRRAIGMSAMSFAYALGMEDNEEYKNATAEERASNFFVPYPGGALKIPIPYEVGLLFKTLPEMAARAMSKGLDEADWAALRTAALRQVPGASNALVLPQGIKPLAEIAFNHNIYTGAEIESEAQQKIDPGQRFNESTSELAKAIGDAANISPVKIEHLVRGYLGGLPIAAASLANEVLADKSTPDRKASQSPIVGGFIADSIGRGAVERAYAKSKAIAQAGATYDKLVKDGKFAAAIKYREDNLNVMMAEPLNDRFTTFMNGIRAERARVLQSELSGSEKRRYLDEIEKHRNKQADMFVDAVKSVATAH